jgi:acyl carrier protein
MTEITHATARDAVFGELVALGRDPAAVTDEARLIEELDLDSLSALELAMRLSDKLGLGFETSELWSVVTVGDVVDAVVRHAAQQANLDVGSKEAALVQSAYDAWNRDDLEAQLALLHPDFEYVTSGLFPGLAPTYRGREGYRDFWRDFKQVWESLRIDVQELHEHGERYLALLNFEACSRDGLTVRRQFGNVVTVRDGLAMRIEAFGSWDEAREAVGMPDSQM